MYRGSDVVAEGMVTVFNEMMWGGAAVFCVPDPGGAGLTDGLIGGLDKEGGAGAADIWLCAHWRVRDFVYGDTS